MHDHLQLQGCICISASVESHSTVDKSIMAWQFTPVGIVYIIYRCYRLLSLHLSIVYGAISLLPETKL